MGYEGGKSNDILALDLSIWRILIKWEGSLHQDWVGGSKQYIEVFRCTGEYMKRARKGEYM